MDATHDSKQHYATPSFRELHKVQRQVLQPAAAYVADQSTTSIGATTSQAKLTQEGACDDSLQGRHSFSAGSQAQSRNKTQVFLPGESASVYKSGKTLKKLIMSDNVKLGLILGTMYMCAVRVLPTSRVTHTATLTNPDMQIIGNA